MTLVLKGSRKYPSLPPIKGDLASHTEALVAIREGLEIGQRRTQDLFNSFVRVQDLLDLGLIDLKGNTQSVVGADLSQIANIGDLSGAALGDFLRYDGTEWTNDQINAGDITQIMVTQHQLALTITWGQITGEPTFVEASDLSAVAFSGAYSDLTGAPPDISTLTFLTEDDETASAPNSRQLLPGSNISFDDTTPGQRTINASGGGGGGGGYPPALGYAGW